MKKGVQIITIKKIDDLNDLKLWQLLLIGLRDLRKQEKAPGCRVIMSTWLDGCDACLAGCVLKWTCGLTRASGTEAVWVYALDRLRVGAVNIACISMGRPVNIWLNREIAPYHHRAKFFWRDIGKLYRDLRLADL